MLSAVCRFIAGMIFHAGVIAQRTRLKNVIPCGDSQRGNLNILVVFLDGPLLPIGVIGGVIEPVAEVGRKVASQRRAVLRNHDIEDGIILQRQNGVTRQRVGLLSDEPVVVS